MPLPEFHALVNEAKKEIQEIGPDELARMQRSGENVTVIDVREREDAAKDTIPGAVNVPRGILEHDIDKVTTDKDRKMVLFCGGGSRSALAAASLKKMGFNNVISLAGGFRGWKDSQNKKPQP